MNLALDILLQSWNILLESSAFILLGLIVSGLLRVFLNPGLPSSMYGGIWRCGFCSASCCPASSPC